MCSKYFSVHALRTISMHSRNSSRERSTLRGLASRLNAVTSCGRLARPKPISAMRPRNIWSSRVMFSAARSGCHSGSTTTAIPRRIRSVRAPTSAASMKGFGELS